MNEKISSSTSHFIYANSILVVIVITLIGAPFLTPWQLFQQLCPYLNAQSPQCNLLQQQLQQQQQQQPFLSQPYQQQPYPQQQLCPDGSLPDVNGNCQSIQPQQPSASLPYIP
jgi:hypothetical protein